MKKFKGNVNSIQTLGLVDGPGVRVVVFMQGCPIRCIYCHNPETWGTQKVNEYTPKELVDFVLKYKNYISNGGGVTFSGGEPLLQQEFVMECAKLLKQHGVHVCLDTSGSVLVNCDLLDYVDLVILDVKAITSKSYELITRAKMDSFNKFLELCKQKNKKLWIRQVIIPNINDDEMSIEDLAVFVAKIPNVEKIELLPYHTMGLSKYEQLKIDNLLKNTPAMDSEKCKSLETLLLSKIKNITNL